MKKIIKTLTILLFFTVFFTPILATAQTTVEIQNPVKITTIEQFLNNAKNFLWALVVPLSTIMMIWAGILFLTSEGDPQKVTKAKTLVTYIVIGLVVALMATGFSLLLQSLMK